MKTTQIIVEEFKAAGIDVLEENAKVAVKVIFEKILPKLASSADEATVKQIAGFGLMFSPMLEKALLELAEKINPAD